jgi:hypothetical protein
VYTRPAIYPHPPLGCRFLWVGFPPVRVLYPNGVYPGSEGCPSSVERQGMAGKRGTGWVSKDVLGKRRGLGERRGPGEGEGEANGWTTGCTSDGLGG